MSLKKQKGQDGKARFFCGGKGDLRCPSEEGKNRIIEAAKERQKLNDQATSSIIKKILPGNGQEIPQFKYHHQCYSNFTHKGKIERLRRKREESQTKYNEGVTSTEEGRPSRRSRREHAIDWNLCMFCQDTSIGNMHNVSTMELSEKIIGLAQSDLIMRVRMANVSDLVASEGKYHLKCWVLFQRKIGKLNKQDSIHDPCLDKLCNDILNGLADGHVYDMGCVWSQYVKSCSIENVNIPQKYQSRKNSFYDDVKKALGEQASFARPINQQAHLLIYPSKKSQLALAQQLATTIDDEGSDIILPLQDNSVQQLVHTALHIRNELENTEGHKSGWGGIDSQHVKQIIPDSLYLFISIFLGGTNVLDNDQTLIDKLHNNICSTAQDIIYLASGKKKLTPKHIGLGLTLHQATRSEKLVEMFHAAGHTIGMDTIRRIDTTIASDIVDSMRRMIMFTYLMK